MATRADTLRMCAWAGIVSTVLFLPLTGFDLYSKRIGLNPLMFWLYALTLLFALITYTLFGYGFAFLGNEKRNELLIFSPWGVIAVNTASILLLLASLFKPELGQYLIDPYLYALMGLLVIIFGFTLLTLDTKMGMITGIFTMASGVGLIGILINPIVFFFGFILAFPSYLFQIKLLFDSAHEFKGI